jgi:hypothetical protein
MSWSRVLLEKLIHTQIIDKKCPPVIKYEGSLPGSQQPANDPVLRQLIPAYNQNTTSGRSILINYHSPSISIFPVKICTHFLSPSRMTHCVFI